jgi:hypothetical protein
MQVLQRQNKGAHLNTLERFYIYAEYVNNNHLNDENTIFPNKIFDALLKTTPTPPPPSGAVTPKPITPTGALHSNIRNKTKADT